MVDAEDLPEESQKKGAWRTLTNGEKTFQPFVEPNMAPVIGSSWRSRHKYDGSRSSGIVIHVSPAFYSCGLMEHNPSIVILAGKDLAGFHSTFAYSLTNFFRVHEPADRLERRLYKEFYKEFYGEEA